MLEVMIRIVFLKSTVRPCESVIRPSSSTCSSTLNTSGCAFSISSKSTTEYGFLLNCFRQLSALIISDISRRRSDQIGTRSISPCTHSYRYAPYYSHHQTDSAASAFASSVLPTPVGPRKRNEPIGFVGSLIPALERMIASVTCSTPSS